MSNAPVDIDSAPHPQCPSCGYIRVGIAPDARCPECGAEGLEGCVILHGRARGSMPVYLVAFALNALIALGLLISARRPYGVCEVLAFLFFAVSAAIPGVRILRRRTPASGIVVWTVHPTGIAIREGRRTTRISVEHIGRLDCADSIFGRTSQFMLVPRRTSLQGVVGRTRVMYLHGEKPTRWSQWRAAREVLGLD